MKAKSLRKKLVFGLAFLGCLAAQSVMAFDVNLLAAQYTTYVCGITNEDAFATVPFGDFSLWSPGISRMTTTDEPASDTVTYNNVLLAHATAQPFSLRAHSDGWRLWFTGETWHHSTAGAKSEIWFCPVTSGATTLDFKSVGYYVWAFSRGYINLTEVTSGRTLWEYGWDLAITDPPFPWQDGQVPWTEATPSDPNDSNVAANLLLNTTFDSAKTYKLTMFTQTFADEDDQIITMNLSGLSIVPEPSVLAICSGAVLLAFRRKSHVLRNRNVIIRRQTE